MPNMASQVSFNHAGYHYQTREHFSPVRHIPAVATACACKSGSELTALRSHYIQQLPTYFEFIIRFKTAWACGGQTTHCASGVQRYHPCLAVCFYRRNHSTETAMLKICNDALLTADNGMVTLVVPLDYSAAFDTVDHAIMLDILERRCGLTGEALQ